MRVAFIIRYIQSALFAFLLIFHISHNAELDTLHSQSGVKLMISHCSVVSSGDVVRGASIQGCTTAVPVPPGGIGAFVRSLTVPSSTALT
jgi:hypothetical protein